MTREVRHMMMVTGSFLLVLALGGVLLVVPARRQFNAVVAETAELYRLAEELSGYSELIAELQADLDDERQRVAEELKVIPVKAHVADLMRRLSLPVDRENVFDQTFEAKTSIPALTEGEIEAQAVPLRVEMQGTFDAVFAVVMAAEAMDHLVRVGGVRITASRSGAGGRADGRSSRAAVGAAPHPLVNATIDLEAIYVPQAKDAEPEEEPS